MCVCVANDEWTSEIDILYENVCLCVCVCVGGKKKVRNVVGRPPPLGKRIFAALVDTLKRSKKLFG